MSAATRRTEVFTGWHMLAWIVGFFAVVIAVNIGLAVVASRSWTGLVVDNSYVASQEFETKRLAHEAQIKAGWVATFSYADGNARIVVIDSSSAEIDLGAVTLQVNRPVGGHDDQALTLMRDKDGGYSSPLKLQPGVWEAKVVAADTPLGWFEQNERFQVEAAP